MPDEAYQGEALHKRLADVRREPSTSLAAKAALEKTATVLLARPVRLTLDDHSHVALGEAIPLDQFPAEVEVPASLARHPYLLRNVAKPKK